MSSTCDQSGSRSGTQRIFSSSPFSSVIRNSPTGRPGCGSPGTWARPRRRGRRAGRRPNQRAVDEPVVRRVLHRREEHPVQEDRAGLVVGLVLVPRSLGDLHDDRQDIGRRRPSGESSQARRYDPAIRPVGATARDHGRRHCAGLDDRGGFRPAESAGAAGHHPRRGEPRHQTPYRPPARARGRRLRGVARRRLRPGLASDVRPVPGPLTGQGGRRVRPPRRRRRRRRLLRRSSAGSSARWRPRGSGTTSC